tara:strand:- start:634 stop:1329 length:696 start_codon:yes stop_codon:yes gene_type:complete
MEPKDIDWINFWDKKALSSSDFEATGRGNMSIFGLIHTFHDCYNYLELNKSDNFLDIGCGSGLLSLMISNFVKLVTGVDISKNMIKRAILNCQDVKNLKFKRNSITDMSFKKEQFDKILIYSVLHYLKSFDEVESVVKKLKKITKKNSRIFIAAIPDFKKKKIYIDFIEKNFKGEKKKLEIRAIDKILWFDKNKLSKILKSYNFKFKFKSLNPNIWQNFYMFDCIIEGFYE